MRFCIASPLEVSKAAQCSFISVLTTAEAIPVRFFAHRAHSQALPSVLGFERLFSPKKDRMPVFSV